MNKAVMLSIQPKWCELIARGKKTIEVRKSRPKIDTPFKCYIYMTKNGNHVIRQLNNGAVVDIDYKMCGKVIGEFVCNWIDDIRPADAFYNEIGYDLDDYQQSKTCLTREELKNYGKGRPFYGWHISQLKIYDKPKELCEFYKPCPDKFQYCRCCTYGSVIIPDDEEEYALYHGGHYDYFETVCHNVMTKPPQSWCYVLEEENGKCPH